MSSSKELKYSRRKFKGFIRSVKLRSKDVVLFKKRSLRIKVKTFFDESPS